MQKCIELELIFKKGKINSTQYKKRRILIEQLKRLVGTIYYHRMEYKSVDNYNVTISKLTHSEHSPMHIPVDDEKESLEKITLPDLYAILMVQITNSKQINLDHVVSQYKKMLKVGTKNP